MEDFLYWAKTKQGAVVPTKDKENAGYDIYACLEPIEIDGTPIYELLLEKDKINMIPTGLASYMNDTTALSLRHERSSVAKNALFTIAGLIDSTYQGEIQLMVMPLYKNILITSEVNQVEDLGHVILYPYEKAICQAVQIKISGAESQEISYEELKAMPSTRGTGGWGSSQK